MKRVIFEAKNRVPILFLMIAVFSLASCESEFDVDRPDTSGSAPPVITSVSDATEDMPVTQGVLESTYIIRGANLSTLTAIYFNGIRAGFNPALGTDELVFVTIPEEAPFVGQDNVLRLENSGGSVEYDFSLLTITDFSEGTTEDGIKTVTLYGGDFSETSTVTFISGTEEDDNVVEREAEILNVSETEVTVLVPPGIEQAFIFLETSRGAVAQSDSYGFNYSIFIDELNADWTMSQWGGTFDVQNTDPALGEFSIKSTREAWSGLTFLPTTPISWNTYNNLTVSIYGTVADQKVNIAINDFEGVVLINVIEGQWTKFTIPLSNFYPNGGAPAVINRIDFQEASNTGNAQYIFYVDDFGFL